MKNNTWFTLEEQLPVVGKYVIVKLQGKLIDDTDNENNKCTIAKLIKGISLIERHYLSDSDPRKFEYRDEDVWGDNLVPYAWQKSLSTEMFRGKQVLEWKYID